MNKIEVKDKRKVILNVLQGVAFDFALKSEEAEWGSYDELVLEVKGKNDLNLRPIVRLELEKGLIVDGIRLMVSFASNALVKPPANILYWDLKGKKGGIIIPILPGEIRIANTTTDI